MREKTKKLLLLKRKNLERLSREVARRYNGHHRWQLIQPPEKPDPAQAERRVKEWMEEIKNEHGEAFLNETLRIVGDGTAHSLAELIRNRRWVEAFQVIQNLERPLY